MRMPTMVVDDQPDVRFLLRVLIDKANDGLVVVAEAATGAEALDRAEEHDPLVIVMDEMMPGMSGIEAVQRLRAVAKRRQGTLNDVVLALCAGAMRRLLAEQDSLPTEALTTMMPVNLRPKDDPGGGNAVGAILATLATDVDDPGTRFAAIVESTRRAKEQLKGMSSHAILQYSAMLIAPMLLSQPPGAAGRVRPAFNLVISNVPGPCDPLYFRGYKLDAYYPLSIPFHGYGLNITVVTYVDTLNFGFTGDRDALPHLQRLAVYSREALEELEALPALDASTPPRKSTAPAAT